MISGVNVSKVKFDDFLGIKKKIVVSHDISGFPWPSGCYRQHRQHTIKPTCAELEQFPVVACATVVGGAPVVVVPFTGSSSSSLSFVKIVWKNLSWNSLANSAACFSGLITSFFSLSQSQVWLVKQLPANPTTSVYLRNLYVLRIIYNSTAFYITFRKTSSFIFLWLLFKYY